MKILNIMKIVVLVTAVNLSGCIMFAPIYQEPKQGPIAHLSFIQTPELKYATVAVFNSGYNCKGPRNLRGSQISSGIDIPANQELAFNMVGGGCDMLFSILPTAGQKYILYFRILNSTECIIKVGKVTQDQIVPIKINKRDPSFFQLTNDDPFCNPINKQSDSDKG